MGSLKDLLYAFEIRPASDYRKHLNVGFISALATSKASALVVVSQDAYPRGPIPPYYPWSSFSMPPTAQPTPLRGFHPVCIAVAGQKPLSLVIAERDLILPPDAATPVGPFASRFALLDHSLGEVFAMTWEPTSNSMWLITTERRLVRLDSGGRVTGNWQLPSGPSLQPEPAIQGGLVVQPIPAADYFFDRLDLAVDPNGAVWIAAGYGLIRFDPGTGRSSVRIVPSDPRTIELDNGNWLSAVTSDGDDALVFRNGIPELLRVSPNLKDVVSIPLPKDTVDVTGIAVSGDRIFVARTSSPTLLILDRDGAVLATGSAIGSPRTMRSAPDGKVAFMPTWQLGTDGWLVGKDGTGQGLAIPMEQVAIADFYNGQRILTATDWIGHIWYAARESGSEILVVDAIPHPK